MDTYNLTWCYEQGAALFEAALADKDYAAALETLRFIQTMPGDGIPDQEAES